MFLNQGSVPLVVFLCGANKSQPRDDLREFLARKSKPKMLVFYADTVWERIAELEDRTALELEAELAAMADVVVIVVESPGTFAELGAFSLSDELRKKLLPIVDAKHRTANSFLASGPLRWIDRDSRFRPTVYVRQDSILEVGEVIRRRILQGYEWRSWTDLQNPLRLLWVLVDLVSVIWPCTLAMIHYYVRGTVMASKKWDQTMVKQTLELSVAMGLIDSLQGSDGSTYFYRTDVTGLSNPFHYLSRSSLIMHRARHLGALSNLPGTFAVLDQIKRERCSKTR